MDFRLLGPLEVVADNGNLVALGALRQRLLLSVLLWHAGRVTAVSELIDSVYETDPPQSAAHAIQVYVSALRKSLGPERLVHRPPGYVLLAEPDEIDLSRFDRLIADGQLAVADGRLGRGAELFGQAEALVRGKPLADLEGAPFADRVSVVITERVDAAAILRTEAALALGRHAALIPELGSRLAANPLDEVLRSQLMLALYRSGRQSQALDLFDAGRRFLADELGLDPGQRLSAMQQAILRQDAALDLPTPTVWTPPEQLDLFVGREAELADLAAAVVEPGARLVTLTGVGGTGKSRLAVETARAVLDRFEAGAAVIALAPVRDGSLVAAAISAGLDIRPPEGPGDLTALTAALKGRRLLLVLDNFEHVMSARPVVADLLTALPDLHLLVTSQVPLKLRGERVWPVQPLALPDTTQSTDADQAPAVQLFVTRARAVDPDFAITSENALTVAAICRRLDGLPLALELAAGRVGLLEPHSLLSRLERRLPVLVGGTHDVPERHQTLRATIDWSYELLSPEQRRLFGRLSLLAGGGDLETLEVLAEGDDPTSLVGQLLDASLLVRLDGPGVRLSMLQTVREYAGEMLSATEDQTVSSTLLARHFVDRLHGLRDLGTRAALGTLDGDFATVRALLPLLFDRSPVLAAELVAAAEDYFLYRGLVAEGLRWSRAALKVKGVGLRARHDLWIGVGFLSLVDDDLFGADEALVNAVAVARDLQNDTSLSLALTQLAWVTLRKGELPESALIGAEAIAVADASGDAVARSEARNVAFAAAAEQGRYDDAFELLDQAISLCPPEATGAMTGYYGNRTLLLAAAGDGDAAYRTGQYTLGMARQENDFYQLVTALDHAAWASWIAGHHEEASHCWREALLMRRKANTDGGFDEPLWGLSVIAAARGDAVGATRLAAAAKRRERITSATIQKLLDPHLARLRSSLGDRGFEQTWREGLGLQLEEALSLALALTA